MPASVLVHPEAGEALEPLGKAFITLIKMIITPIIYCTIVLGVGSITNAATITKALTASSP